MDYKRKCEKAYIVTKRVSARHFREERELMSVAAAFFQVSLRLRMVMRPGMPRAFSSATGRTGFLADDCVALAKYRTCKGKKTGIGDLKAKKRFNYSNTCTLYIPALRVEMLTSHLKQIIRGG